MQDDARALRAADQLAALLNSGRLPERVRAYGETVRARLDAPVRLAVIGQPGSGMQRVVNDLVGSDAVPEGADTPPVELSFGEGLRFEAMTADGDVLSDVRTALDRLDPAALAFLRIDAPLPLLERVSFLTVPLEGGEAGAAAALGWACRRADMLLWCSHALDGLDRDLWPRLPDEIQDHAFLVVTGPSARRASGPARAHAACFFRDIRDLGADLAATGRDGRVAGKVARVEDGFGAEGIAALRSALLTHVSLARREDLEGALAFLDQHVAQLDPRSRSVPTRPRDPIGARLREEPDGGTRDAAEAPRVQSRVDATDMPAARPVPVEPPDDADRARDPDAATQVALRLAAQAGEVEHMMQGAQTEETAVIRALDGCSAALDACAELALSPGDDGALVDLIAEAQDVMVLMRLESSLQALVDTVALLVQVQRECRMAGAA